jgi:hypothetical protein
MEDIDKFRAGLRITVCCKHGGILLSMLENRLLERFPRETLFAASVRRESGRIPRFAV